jgi:hypothetical protein
LIFQCQVSSVGTQSESVRVQKRSRKRSDLVVGWNLVDFNRGLVRDACASPSVIADRLGWPEVVCELPRRDFVLGGGRTPTEKKRPT